jgi:hypothetical protein
VAAFDLYRKYILQHGCDDRRADFFGTLLAGRSLLIDDEVPQESIIQQYVAGLRDRLNLIMIDDSDTTDGQACLNRLLDTECAAIRDGIKRSIGQIVANAMNLATGLENEKLMPLGLRIVETRGDQGRERMLFVANQHLGLTKIFHNTRWADGNWSASLRRLKPDVRPAPSPVFVGRKSRGLLIPKAILPPSDDGDEIEINHDPPLPAP